MTKTELNFNDLPSDIKRLIFDKNRQAAQDKTRGKYEMVLVELKNLHVPIENENWSDFKPSDLRNDGWLFRHKTYEHKTDLYLEYADPKFIPEDDFCQHYLIDRILPSYDRKRLIKSYRDLIDHHIRNNTYMVKYNRYRS